MGARKVGVESAEADFVDLRLALDHLEEFVVVVAGGADALNHLVGLLGVFAESFESFAEETASVDGLVA